MRPASRCCRLAACVLLTLAARSAAAQASPYWNAQWGRPQGASAGLGLLLGGGGRGDQFRIATKAALVELRPGIDGGALHFGFAPVAMKTRAFAFGGLALKGTLLRTWGTPNALPPRQTFAGAELHFAWILKGSVGVLWRVSGSGAKTHVLTWGVGLGL